MGGAPASGQDVTALMGGALPTPDFKTETIGDTSMLTRLAELLPSLGGAAGGIVGGIGGTVAGMGVGGVPGAVGGAALGGGAGEALKQILQKLRGVEPPGTALGAAADIGKEGGIQAAYELAGQGIAKGAGAVGRSFMENAVRPPIGLVKEFPDVMNTIVKERLPVGGLFGGPSGSQQAKTLLRKSASTTRGLLKGAEKAGTTFDTQQMMAQEIGDLALQIRSQPISGPDLKRLSDMAMTYVAEHGEMMTPRAVKDMKQAAQSLAKPVFKAQQAGGGVSADQAVGARFNEAIASGAKKALETISGIAESETRTKNLIGATRALRQAELRRLPAAAEGISVVAATMGGLLQPNSGLDDKLRNATLAWIVARGMASPRAISRAGLILTSAQAQAVMKQFPRLGEAVMNQLSVGQAGADQLPTADTAVP